MTTAFDTITTIILAALLALTAGVASAQTISLASTMDGESFISEDVATGGFGQIQLGDGTLGGLPQSEGDADAWYALADFGQPDPALLGTEIDLFPREADFLVGEVGFDETLVTGVGVETVQITSIDLGEFWTSDPNRVNPDGGTPATVITDLSDHAIGLIWFNLPGDLTFDPLDAADTVTFTDGLLTSIDLSIPAQFNIDTTDFGGGPTAWDGTFSITGDQISYQILDTETVGAFGNSTITADMTGTVNAVNNFAVPGTIKLAGPATGFVAINNFKNSSTENGIEGKDAGGNFDPNHNGLPEYPNFQIPAGFTNEGIWTAVIASPQSTESDYAAPFSSEFYDDTPLTVNNQDITQPDFATLSAGVIEYNSAAVPATGTVTLPVADLDFDFNTFAWDGNVTPAQTGDPRSNFDAPYADPDDPIMISPFSPVYTPYNDGSGAGNAQVFYQISLSNATGSGLTFTDGVLTDMDIQGDVLVQLFVAPFFTFGSADFTGTFTATGLDYAFDVSGTETLAIFSGINLIMNRLGGVRPPNSFAVSAMVDGGNGSVSCDPAFVLPGGSSQCTAVPDVGFKVAGWTGACAAAGASEVCSLSDIQADQSSMVTFTEIEPGTLALSAASFSINEDGGSLTVSVERSGGSDGAASVSYATSDGSATAPDDYVTTTGTLDWADGDSAAKTFSVTIIDDTAFEGDETFEVNLSSAIGATLGSPASATVTIVENDSAPIGSVRFLSISQRLDEDEGPVLVPVERVNGSAGAISVDYTTVDGTATAPDDYIATTGTLQWADGDDSVRLVEVELVDDAVVEMLEFFEIELLSATGGATIDEPSVILIEVRDDDDVLFSDGFEALTR